MHDILIFALSELIQFVHNHKMFCSASAERFVSFQKQQRQCIYLSSGVTLCFWNALTGAQVHKDHVTLAVTPQNNKLFTICKKNIIY